MVSRRGRSRNWPAHLWPSAKGRIPTRSQTSTAAAGSALPRPISTTAQCLSSSSTSLAASFCLERQNNCRFATETSYPSHYRWGPYNSRSEEHTSELQSRFDLVCRLLLEKKKKII